MRLAAGIAIILLAADGLAAAESVRVVRGPWWWFAPDGSPQIGVATAGIPQVPASAELDGAETGLSGEVLALADRTDGADHVLVLRLRAGAAGRLRLRIADQPVAATLRRPPAMDAPA
ncbi:MAG: hypothetical protein J0M02_18120, partial [Planctomycetes bacterium]|nr:hypothetical protein [Planctomycetota bacterium]